MEYKIGVIGDVESVIGFMAVGFTVVTVETAEEAANKLKRMAKENFAILFLTERLAKEMPDAIMAYKDSPLPSVITIPGKEGATGFGLANIKKSVERAVGADILFKDEKTER